MNLLAHPFAQRQVDALMPLDAAHAFELGRDDGGKEVTAIAFDFTAVTRQASDDEILNFEGCWIRHDFILTLWVRPPERSE